MNRSKTYKTRQGTRQTANEIWDRYVGSQSPREWLRDMPDTTNDTISSEVNAYCEGEPAVSWITDSGDDCDVIGMAIYDLLAEYRDAQAAEERIAAVRSEFTDEERAARVATANKVTP